MLTLSAKGETTYRNGKNLLRTPDILISQGTKTECVVECKAKRMTFEAKFGPDPASSAAAGYHEMAKAVVQIWRYAHDCRVGLTGNGPIPDAIGVVLTLDEWLSSSKELQHGVIEQAHVLADSDTRIIEAADRLATAFTSIRDLEIALAQGSDESLLRTLRELTGDYRGWLLQLAQENFIEPESEGRDYPFLDQLGKVLPWWSKLEAKKGRHAE